MRDLQHDIIIGKHYQRDAEEWCRNRWGKRWSAIDNREGIWCCFWTGTRGEHAGKYIYHFKNESDALLFGLRWS